ncbi:MAG: hypothetical protein IH627_10115 [Rubrivivax sp.]|nr:hypothetical protein [Rubrivivax sp.]
MKLPFAAGLSPAHAGALVLAQAQTALYQYADADLALGEKLIHDNRCSACHVRTVGGDGTSIYRPQGRIDNPGALRGRVGCCITELNLGLFPEEVTAIAAVLQRDHYRFPAQSNAPR